MTDDNGIRVNASLTIPRAELLFRASRSGGPGGQHVNTSSSRIEVVWDVAASPSLDDAQRARLLSQLASRLDSSGKLRLVAQEERSQLRNREAVVTRLVDIVTRGLIVRKARRRTRPTAASREARLAAKRKHSARKRDRRPPAED